MKKAFDFITKLFTNKFTTTVAGLTAAAETISRQVKKEVVKAKKTAITLFITYTLLILSFTMFGVAFAFWLPDRFNLSIPESFALTGVAVLVISILFYLIRTRK